MLLLTFTTLGVCVSVYIAFVHFKYSIFFFLFKANDLCCVFLEILCASVDHQGNMKVRGILGGLMSFWPWGEEKHLVN